MEIPHKYCAWCGYRFGDTDFSCGNCQSERGFFNTPEEPDGQRSPSVEKAKSAGRKRRASLGGESEERWQKVLWKDQVFDDNFIDKETFLNSLVTNANVRPFHYPSMVRGSLPVIRAIACTALFGLVFTFCWRGSLSAETLLAADATLFFLAMTVLRLYCDSTPIDVRQTTILVAALGALTPLMHTMTREWHDDTILFFSITCLALHLLTGDYRTAAVGALSAGHGVTSLNAAIFASVMLASRLQCDELVFAFLLFAIEIFALLPLFCHQLEVKLPDAARRLSVLLAVLATVAMFPVSKFVSLGHLLTVMCIMFVCPLWLMYIQRYKSLIQGQWDEAVPGVQR